MAKNNNEKKYISEEELLNLMDNDTVSLKDYYIILRVNYLKILLITAVAVLVAGIYAYRSLDIYKSTTMLKLSKPPGNILEAPLISQFSDNKSLFVLNEIEILKSYTIREKVAQALVDSFQTNKTKQFFLILNREKKTLLPVYNLVKMLGEKTTIEQKKDLELIDITIESPSPYEAALIANIYAEVYRDLNLSYNRTQMINVRHFLEKQSNDKLNRLVETENSLKSYQEKGGIIALDEQTRALVGQLTDFESQKNAVKIELTMAEKIVADYKKELQKQEPGIASYMDKYAIEPYLQELQKEIARYELKKDITTGNINPELIKDYNNKISELKDKRDKKLEVFKAGMLASSSDEVKLLIQKVLEQEIKYHSLLASYKELSSIVTQYENQFNQLPKRTIDLARLEREKAESEKLYILIQEKYQEAMINEESTPGNVLIIDVARIEPVPYKPNRMLILLTGLILGLGMGVGFVLIINHFDNTIKTPEDIEKLNINLLGWVPQIEHTDNDVAKDYEFIVARKPNSIPSEAYRALRTRIQFSKVGKDAIKTILMTSGSPQEGKTVSSVNLAASFAIAGKKTLIIDCDLRKPRIHKLFNTQKSPGFIDYLFENTSLEKIIRESEIKGLYYISSGVIPHNPAEVLGSNNFLEMINKLKNDFDVIIIDSPPVLSVTDAEILSRLSDVSILITAANVTEIEIMKKSVELLMNDEGTFIGVVLNNFIYRNGYGSYYKNYYYYQKTPVSKKKKIFENNKT